MFATAIILAAGLGKRLRHNVSKPLAKLSNRPVITYSLKVLNGHAKVHEIIIVVNNKNRAGILRQVQVGRFSKVSKIVLGGRRRQDSLGSALKVLDKRTHLVLIHDAARPLITRKIIADCLNQAERWGAAVAGVLVKATIKEDAGNNFVKKTLNRDVLWEIQTPQVFKRGLILKAYKKFGRLNVTDDAALVEKLGWRVKIVKGMYSNIKITTPEDLILAQALARKMR